MFIWGDYYGGLMEDNTDTGNKTAEKPDTLSKEYVSRGDVIDALKASIRGNVANEARALWYSLLSEGFGIVRGDGLGIIEHYDELTNDELRSVLLTFANSSGRNSEPMYARIVLDSWVIDEVVVDMIARNNYAKCLTVFTHTIDICTSPTLGVVMSAEMAGHIAQTQIYYVLSLSNADDVVIQTVDAHFSSIDVLNTTLTTLRDDL